MNTLQHIYGFRVIKNDLLAETTLKKRSIMERLFTRPWQPLKKFESVITGPGDCILDKNRNVIYASGWALDILQKEANKQ